MYFGYGLLGLIYTVIVVWAIIDLLGSRRSGSTTLIWLLGNTSAVWQQHLTGAIFS